METISRRENQGSACQTMTSLTAPPTSRAVSLIKGTIDRTTHGRLFAPEVHGVSGLMDVSTMCLTLAFSSS